MAKHVDELNTELPNVAWVTGVFDVIGVVLLAKLNPVKEVVAGLCPKVNVFCGAAGAGFKAPNCKLVLLLLVVVVLVLIPEEVAVDDEPPN